MNLRLLVTISIVIILMFLLRILSYNNNLYGNLIDKQQEKIALQDSLIQQLNTEISAYKNLINVLSNTKQDTIFTESYHYVDTVFIPIQPEPIIERKVIPIMTTERIPLFIYNEAVMANKDTVSIEPYDNIQDVVDVVRLSILGFIVSYYGSQTGWYN